MVIRESLAYCALLLTVTSKPPNSTKLAEVRTNRANALCQMLNLDKNVLPPISISQDIIHLTYGRQYFIALDLYLSSCKNKHSPALGMVIPRTGSPLMAV